MSYLPHPISTVIFADGEVPSEELASYVLSRASQVIVTDGALSNYYRLTERDPEVVIGDGDSVSTELLERHHLTFTRVDDQMTNDLTKAVHHALRKGWRSITILGGTGLREDHTVANIFLLMDYYESGAEVQMVSDYGTFVPFSGERFFDVPQGLEVSFFSQDHLPMSAEGVTYPFHKAIYPKHWQMTLNSVTECPIRLEAEGIALLYVASERYVPREEVKV